MRTSFGRQAVRISHTQGERLIARDLQDEYDGISRLRERHVAALHDTWGIALGFDVNPGPGGSVLVGPGLAYDIAGRQILLSAPPRPIAGPAAFAPGTQAGTSFDLVISYDPTLGVRALDLLPVPCVGADERGRERPRIAWRRAGTARLGIEVPLVRVQVTAAGTSPLDQSVRRYTQALTRPHIVAGSTPPEQPWELWDEELTPAPDLTTVRVGFQIVVDTSAAGFVGVPNYLASLVPLTPDSVTSVTPGAPPSLVEAGVATFCSLADPRADRFTFQVAFARQQPQVEILAVARTLQTIPWRVAWVGVEPVTGCAPFILWDLVLREIGSTFPFFGALAGNT